MEIADKRASTLSHLLHDPDGALLSSPDDVDHTSRQYPEASKMQERSSGMGYDPAISPEMAGGNPSNSPEIVRSPFISPQRATQRSPYGKQVAEDPELSQLSFPQSRGKSPTFSPEYGQAQWENTYPAQRRFYENSGQEVEDGTRKRPLVFAEQTSLKGQSYGSDPVYAQQLKSTPLQQRAVNFENDGNDKSDLFGEYGNEAIAGSKSSNMHPLEQIERSLPHKLTLQLWQEEERLLRMQIQTHEIDCSRTEQEIYQLFGFDLLFQAIIIAGAAQATVLDCTSAWVPLILSIAASLATFLAIFRKLEAHERFSSQLKSEQSDSTALFEYVEKLKTLGGHFDLNDVPHSSSMKRRENRYPSKMDKVLKVIWSYKFFVLIVLLLFSVLATVSFKKILCSH